MRMLRSKERLHHFGCRTHINYPNVSVLVKNMPLNDMDRYGRVKDLIPIIMGAFNAKITSLHTELSILEQSKSVSRSFGSTQKILIKLTKHLQSNNLAGSDVMRTMFTELNTDIQHMGLDDDQEEHILAKIDAAVHDTLDLVDTGKELKNTFNIVLTSLKALMQQQRTLLDELAPPEEIKNNETAEIERAAGASAGSVELF